jgi:hypothetical protein
MAFPPEQISLTMSGPPPATQADDLGMLLQTKSHYPKHFKKKKIGIKSICHHKFHLV